MRSLMLAVVLSFVPGCGMPPPDCTPEPCEPPPVVDARCACGGRVCTACLSDGYSYVLDCWSGERALLCAK